MPNGKCFRPYRLPGKYCCIVCRELKDAEEFYKDSSRYNGCCSRCKDCDNNRWREEKIGPDVKVRTAPAQCTSTDNRWAERQIKKRVEEIKSDYRIVKRDKHGLPVFVEKTTHFSDGSREVRFLKGTGG